jgi:hypothetical protein
MPSRCSVIRPSKFGVGSVVLAVGATVGAIVGQAAVVNVGVRPAAATGMALMGAGSLLLTQVSVGGGYFGDIFFGLLVFGPGVGLTFVTATVGRHGRDRPGKDPHAAVERVESPDIFINNAGLGHFDDFSDPAVLEQLWP